MHSANHIQRLPEGDTICQIVNNIFEMRGILPSKIIEKSFFQDFPFCMR